MPSFNTLIPRGNFFTTIILLFDNDFFFLEDRETTEGFLNDLLLEEMTNQQQNMKEVRSQLDQQTKLLRLIMQVIVVHF